MTNSQVALFQRNMQIALPLALAVVSFALTCSVGSIAIAIAIIIIPEISLLKFNFFILHSPFCYVVSLTASISFQANCGVTILSLAK